VGCLHSHLSTTKPDLKAAAKAAVKAAAKAAVKAAVKAAAKSAVKAVVKSAVKSSNCRCMTVGKRAARCPPSAEARQCCCMETTVAETTVAAAAGLQDHLMAASHKESELIMSVSHITGPNLGCLQLCDGVSHCYLTF